MFSQTELIYSIACTVYVVTCLMFAAVRWFHVCPGAKENKSYYHPDRKLFTLLYSVPVILFPYIFNPGSHASWLLVKGYYPLTHLFYCAVLLFNYFGNVKQWERWHLSGVISSILVFVPVVLLFAIALWPGLQISTAMEELLTIIVFSVGLLMTAYCGFAMWQVWQWIKEYSTDIFSNTDDFPLSYAYGVLVIPVIHALLIWPMVLLESPTLLAVIQILLSVFNVIFLISILPTKRKGNPLQQMIEDSREADMEEILELTVSTEENKKCPPQPSYTSSVERPDAPPETAIDKPFVKVDRKPKDIPEQTRQKIIDGIEKALVSNGQNAVFAPHLAQTTLLENNHINAMYEYFIGHIIKNYHLDTLKLPFAVHYNVVEKLLDEVFQYREHPTEWYGVFNNTDCRIKLHRADDEKRSIRLLADSIAQYSCAFEPKRLIGINTDLFVGINMVVTLFGGHIMIVNTDTDTSFKLIQLLHQNINKYED